MPVVVTEVDTRIQGDYGPAYFIQLYGQRKVILHDCESNHTRSATVSDFFRTFGVSTGQRRIYKLKVHTFCLSSELITNNMCHVGLATAKKIL
jgi:hypothetical protein